MKTSATQRKIGHRRLGGVALTVALIAFTGGLSSVSARADDDDRGRGAQHDHAKPNRRPSHPSASHSNGYYAAPRYVYAPPPVYYAPPPPPPAISFVFPFVFR